MAVPTVNVTCTVTNQTGAVVPNATVTAQLTALDLYGASYVFPVVQTFTTDVNGFVTMPLFPNKLGSRNTAYHFVATDPVTGKIEINVTVVVPNQNIDLSVLDSTSPLPLYPIPFMQPHSAVLDAAASVVPGADKLSYWNGSISAALTSLTAFGRSLIGAASAAAAATLLGLGTLSNPVFASVTATTVTATNLAGTLTTAAQPNVTSLGQLTALSMGGQLTMGANILALAGATVSGQPTWSSTQNMNISGNAATATIATLAAAATVLATPRNINGVAFDGSANITVTAAAGTLTGNTLAAGVLASSLTSVGVLTSLSMGGTLTMGANTLALASATVSGAPTWSSNQAITLSTAAQPNITSLGTLTSLTVSGASSLGTAVAGQYAANITARFNGTTLEFGHANTAGYGSTIGAHVNDGTPSLAFHAGQGTTNNTYKTLGIKGSVFQSDLVGGFVWVSVTNANADNQAGTVVGSLTTAGLFTAANLSGTLSTAAQPNVTSLGTLTALTISGTLTMTAAASKIVPGATSFSHRNNADNADNILINDNGNTTVRGTLTANGFSVGYLEAPFNQQDANYTLVLADSAKTIYHTSGSAHTWTIPANGSVAYPVGTILTFINDNGGGNVSIAITTDTLRFIPGGTTGTRTLAANGRAVAVKMTATTWQIGGTNLT